MKFKTLIAAGLAVAGIAIGGLAVAQTIFPTSTTVTATWLMPMLTSPTTANNAYVTALNFKKYVLGTASSSTVGFYGTTAVTQPTAAAQAAVTDNSSGTASPTTAVVNTLGTQTIAIPFGAMQTLANGQSFYYDPGFAGTITAANYRVGVTAGAGSSSTATVTPFVNTSATAITGGVISLTTASTNAVGAKTAGTAVTLNSGANFTATQPIGVSVSGVSAFSAGSGYVELTVVNTDLANSVATVIAQGNALRSALVALGLIKGS